MAPIVASADIDRAPAHVYAYVTDPTRFSEWQQGVVSGRMETGDPSLPERCITVRRIGFTERASNSDLVHADPPRTWRVQGIDGPIRAGVDVTIEPIKDAASTVAAGVACGFVLGRRDRGSNAASPPARYRVTSLLTHPFDTP